MKVQVGDRGRYRSYGACEVVYVSSLGEFVTHGGPYVPQVHNPDGTGRTHRDFDFTLRPKTVRVAVWASSDGTIHCVKDALSSTDPAAVYVDVSVPQS